MAEDAYKGDGLNRYVYVRNNPLVFIDPTGYACSEGTNQESIITIGNIIVRDGIVSNGVTTGYFRDVVRGLGGCSIEMGNGQVLIILPNYETGKSRILTLDTINRQITDIQGNKLAGASILNGRIQVGVRQFAQLAGVEDTLSYWTETYGGKPTNYVTVKPDMKYAPVKVTRAGDNININAYINFTGDADRIIPTNEDGTLNIFTNAEVVARGIQNKWSGFFQGTWYDFELGKNINLETTVYSNQLRWQKNLNNDKIQEQFIIDIGGIGRSYQNDANLISGISDLLTGDFYFSNWSPGNVGKIKLFSGYRYSDDTKVYNYSPEQLGSVAAHEFGHILGLGDAYGEGSRPEVSRETSEVPLYDIMRNSYGNVTLNDIEMVWRAWVTNTYQSFQNWKSGRYSYKKSRAIKTY